MAKPIWTPVAQAELEEILLHIGVEQRRPATAERLYYSIRDEVETHARLRKPGHAHVLLPAGHRYLKFKRWLISYELTQSDMIVHRIFDASRDLPGLLKIAE